MLAQFGLSLRIVLPLTIKQQQKSLPELTQLAARGTMRHYDMATFQHALTKQLSDMDHQPATPRVCL